MDDDSPIPVESTTSTTEGRALAADLLNRVKAEMGNAETLFVGERPRVTAQTEESYVRFVRESPAKDGLPADPGVFSDDQLLYLGYLYCASLDSELTADQGFALVARSVAVHAGGDPTAPQDTDFAMALAAVNYAGGSICGEYDDPTQAFVDQLRGEA